MTQKHFKKHSLLFRSLVMITLGFHGGSDGKESTCNARDLCSIPGLGISPGEGNGNRSSILAWEIPWTEEPGSLQLMGSQRVKYNLAIQLPPPPRHKKSKCLGDCLPKGFLPSL